jgi:integrase/recombinase XerC
MIPLTQYKQHLSDTGKADQTITAYLSDLQQFANWFFENRGQDLAPELMTSVDVREYKHALTTDHASPATINRRLAALRSFGAWCASTGQIDYNPLTLLTGIQQQKSAPHWLEADEQHAIARELERACLINRSNALHRSATRDQTIYTILINTGLRISELCDLVWDDVEINERSGKLSVKNGKGAKARTVPLNLATRHAFSSWKETYGSHSPIFQVTPRGVQKRLAEIGRRAKVELTPHRLRHTFGKSLVDAGVSLDKVAAILGHDRLETTAIYTRPSARDLENAVKLLD